MDKYAEKNNLVNEYVNVMTSKTYIFPNPGARNKFIYFYFRIMNFNSYFGDKCIQEQYVNLIKQLINLIKQSEKYDLF